jgi:hypothetical protein
MTSYASRSGEYAAKGTGFEPMALFLGITFALSMGLACLFEENLLGLFTGLSLALVLLPFVLFRRDPYWFAPVYVLSILFAINYPIRLILILFFRRYSGVDLDPWAESYYSDFGLMTRAMALTVIGQISFLTAYYIPPRILLRGIQRWKCDFSGNENTLPRKALVLSLVAWGVFALRQYLGYAVTFDGKGENYNDSYHQILTYVSEGAYFTTALAVVWLSGRQRKPWLGKAFAVVAIAPAMLHFLFVETSKAYLLQFAFILLAGAVSAGRRIRLTYVAILFIYLLFFVWPFVIMYRSEKLETRSLSGANLSPDQQFELAKDVASKALSFGDNLETLVGEFSNRFCAFEALIVTMDRVPTVMPHVYFKDLALLPLVLVPRAVFPMKPASDTQAEYSRKVFQMVNGGNMAAYIMGEGYLNAGEIGVVVDCWIWGLMWAFVYQGFFLPRRRQMVAVAVYVAFLARYSHSFEFPLLTMIGMPAELFVWSLGIYWCISRAGRARSA